jgi:hypothetical protein
VRKPATQSSIGDRVTVGRLHTSGSSPLSSVVMMNARYELGSSRGIHVGDCCMMRP